VPAAILLLAALALLAPSLVSGAAPVVGVVTPPGHEGHDHIHLPWALPPAEADGADGTSGGFPERLSPCSGGGIGGTAFTPIINAPEVAILGLSRARMTPVWDGAAFQPRLMLPLDLSWDHRVVDGAEAARFLAHLARLLGDVRLLLL